MKGRFFFYCGVFILTLSTLMLEIIQTRILSVMVWYHMAFLAISMAMFGMTAGAVWIYFRLHAMDSLTAAKNLTFYTWAFGLAILFSLIGQFSLALVHNASLTYYLTWLLLAAYMAIPFFFSGAAVTLALTRTPFPIHRVYAVDLIGAAVGCLGVLFLLNYTDGPSAVLWTAMAAELGAFSFWLYWRTNETDSHAKPAAWKSPIWLILLLGLAAFFNGATFHGLHPIFSKEKLNERTYPLIYERWNSFSCVRVFDHPKPIPPNLWGPSQIMPDSTRARIKRMYIDGAAGTVLPHFSGDRNEIGYVKYDLPNLGYFIRNQGKGLVIGVGGGRDVLSAKWFGMDEVIGVEINPIFIDILTAHPRFADFNQVNRLPGVTLHVDEARSWLARSQETFDSMQISMIDTWASTTAGAFSLSENGLYTLEAWDLFLSHLNQDGILTVTRWYAPGEVNETGRLIGLAVASLLQNGVAHPQRHLYLASNKDYIATLIVCRSPLSPQDIANLDNTVAQYRYKTLIHPQHPPQSPVLAEIVNTSSLQELQAYTRSLDLDLTPPTDNQPFFFNQLPLNQPMKVYQILTEPRKGGVIQGNLLATGTLLLTLLISFALVLCVIIIPLRTALRKASPGLTVGGTFYFAFLGFGFMLAEIGLMQRLSVFLGHPTYSISVVLFTIILFTGIGSYFSEKWPLNKIAIFTGWALCLGLCIVGVQALIPPLFSLCQSWWTPFRILLSIFLIAPMGLLMGFGFPTGIRLVEQHSKDPTPWFWGINGATGVLASGLAVAIGISFGISMTLYLGALCYLLLIPSAAVIGFKTHLD